MKKNFGFDTKFNKIKLSARSLWMGFERGEGELEIENQGRFDQSRFSQETEAIGQQTPRIGADRPKLRFTQRVSSAGSTLNSDSTPHFLSAPLVQGSSGPFALNQATEEVKVQFSLENEKSISASVARFTLQADAALANQDFSLSAADVCLAKTDDESAAFALASHTQNRLASLFKAASKDEDSAV